MRLTQPRKSVPGDDLVPLINVVFLLLIFFLLAGTLMPAPSAPVEYVKAAAQPAPSIPANAVFVDADGNTYFDGEQLTGDALRQRLKAAEPGAGKIPLVLDRGVRMERLKPVFDDLTAAGIAKVELMTVRGSAR
ncbi:biopolymer transport protein ExbD [Rhodopseudomonas julia]|uniref:Biopolymer transport protein ExbD n=1 Tax=Rhodopseudomonas julia TaxID=200617 RepID=A0ABU0C2Z4_9BRAD|nr:biopolymer transporter ExbD [Rhodopseudomonas julia]MDQ0324291.1 biopolymer transport protein ExbD [Rhodopseudomonas julia]